MKEDKCEELFVEALVFTEKKQATQENGEDYTLWKEQKTTNMVLTECVANAAINQKRTMDLYVEFLYLIMHKTEK